MSHVFPSLLFCRLRFQSIYLCHLHGCFFFRAAITDVNGLRQISQFLSTHCTTGCLLINKWKLRYRVQYMCTFLRAARLQWDRSSQRSGFCLSYVVNTSSSKQEQMKCFKIFRYPLIFLASQFYQLILCFLHMDLCFFQIKQQIKKKSRWHTDRCWSLMVIEPFLKASLPRCTESGYWFCNSVQEKVVLKK